MADKTPPGDIATAERGCPDQHGQETLHREGEKNINASVTIKSSNPGNDHNKPSPKAKWLQAVKTFLADQWILLCIGFVIALSSQVQVPSPQQHTKSTVISYLCVSIIFFSTGCTLDTKVLVRNYSRWKTHLWVQGQCFLMCSGLMFAVVSAAATNRDFMDPGLLIGLVFVSTVPTTIASNVVMTRQAHGNTELTVVQTTIGNFIGVFLAPALVAMYVTVPTWYNEILPDSTGNFTEIYRRVLKQLGLSIYVPLVAGQIVRYFFPKACDKVFRQWKFNKLGGLCMIVIVWSTYDQAFRSSAFDGIPPSNLVFLVFILLAMFLVYFAVSCFVSMMWFSQKDVVAITYCVTGKGPAVGVPLATSFFSGLSLELSSKIQVPIVVYQAIMIAGGSIAIVVFRRWVERDEARRRDVEQVNEEGRPES
ncbi:Solute carrier RCH1 [Fulvia fulva]|uniref:Solute carrier RCH1 n=1 Tax=Passalora fulva TaxID=5499 RepID=A0A9Q8LBA3_PASFU|nr:Solute carrier RCH1 [Fulvia fulva]KAK4632790.1 Solute carrier RCH1 [Fulvia fulva]UJO14201.1 Solute carrier RCH1 [Fulvia fulva]WPV10808.1 Solute carrier RCH1 [Fulvia fulva]